MQVSRRFAYNGLTIRVECPDQAHLTWLEEFLSPAFSPADNATADWTVTLEIDDRRHAALLRSAGRVDRGSMPGFILDGGPVDLASWESPGHDRVFFDAGAVVFYFVNHDGAHTRILSTSRYPSRRLALMRVVRELVMSDSWTRRRFVLHAGACELTNAGIIVAGPKGAGKTTLLMYALGCNGARFIANDRVVVDAGGVQAMARGMPTVITVRERTLCRFPAFAERWTASGYNERLALHEAQGPREGMGAMNLTPAQFCALLGVPLSASARVRILLFPRLTDDAEGLRVQELSPEIASQRLSASIFAADGPQISPVFAVPTHSAAPDQAAVQELSRVLIRQVRCFDCALGQPTPRTGELMQDFLDALRIGPQHT